MQHIQTGQRAALYSVSGTRQIEQIAQAQLQPHCLMQRAGLRVAQLALAIAPHAHDIWLACGSGNNGGDGIEAAMHLHQWGKNPVVTWLGTPGRAPPDASESFQRALQAGVSITHAIPTHIDLCIDALLGIGTSLREPQGVMADWIHHMNSLPVQRLAVDLPSGLDANTGSVTAMHVNASHTLSLLTLKPGLFTAQGRDASGEIWFDDLQADLISLPAIRPLAVLIERPNECVRPFASHKGNFGDVAVIGGALGMTGAAILAATAALHGGAGRVFVSLLDDHSPHSTLTRPELMFRDLNELNLNSLTVVCGCGGGLAIRSHLGQVLSSSAPVVIDADAINAVACDPLLQRQLIQRALSGSVTVMTPHPLEAARLMVCSAAEVQRDRLTTAAALAQRFQCTVVLKGSGTVIASQGEVLAINPTGNGQLATAGTGDVLAGMIGAKLAAGASALKAACDATYQHGNLADQWPSGKALTALNLAQNAL